MARAGFKRTVRRMRHRAARRAAPRKDGELSIGAGPRPARGRTLCAPTAENGPGALAEKTQAQKRDPSKSRFCELRAPVGPDGTGLSSPPHPPLRGHLSLSPLSLCDIIPTPFGLRPFPPDRGNRPLDKGSRPPGGRFTGGHMGPPLRAERTDAIMCVGAGHWPARKRAADSRPHGGKWTEGAALGAGKEIRSACKNTGAPGQKQVKHTPPCCRFRPSGR